jgi:hypothetical protein
LLENAWDVAKGSARAVKDTIVAVQPYTNVFTVIPALAHDGHDAYTTYQEQGLLEAFNQNFNPGYAFLVSVHLCLTAESAEQRGYACTGAVRDAAILATAGAAACRPTIAFGKSRRIPNLADETGELNPGGMLGATGAQTTSITLRQGRGYRVDVENPAPGRRPGQLHLQDSRGGKYLYDFEANEFVGLPRSLAKKIAADPGVDRAINQARRILNVSEGS